MASELEDRMISIITAVAVTSNRHGRSVMERVSANGPATAGTILDAMAEDLYRSDDQRAEFSADFDSHFRDALRGAFGYRAGEEIYEFFSARAAAGDLRSLVSLLPRLASIASESLADYLMLRKETSRHHDELVAAIANEGIEGIMAFDLMEKLRRSRDAEGEALARLRGVLRR